MGEPTQREKVINPCAGSRLTMSTPMERVNTMRTKPVRSIVP